jgi:outer membrane immunogenic protein
MKNFAVAIATLATLMGTPALAADMVTKAPPPPPPPACAWCGWYVGFNVGGIWGTDPGNVATGPTPAVAGVPGSPAGAPTSIPMASGWNNDSALGGFQAGYNYQVNNFVLGLETDFDFSGLNMNTTLNAATVPAGSNAIPGNSFTQNERWQGSVRGRAGVVWNNALLYVTGGFAYADTSFQANFQPTVAAGLPFPGGGGQDSQILTGYTVGGGFDYKYAPNMTIGLEYRYSHYDHGNYNLGTRSTFGGGTAAAPIFAFAPVTANVGLITDQVLLKWNYSFGGGPLPLPMVTK